MLPKFTRTAYGDYIISFNGIDIGIIEYDEYAPRFKYSVYIHDKGKITDRGYDVFDFANAKATAREFVRENY